MRKIIFILLLPMAVRAGEPAGKSAEKCDALLKDITSAVKGKSPGDDKNPELKISEVTATTEAGLRLNSLDDFVLYVQKLEMEKIPNLTYASNHPEKSEVLVMKVPYLKHAYVAIFNSAIYMNWALGRVTTYQMQKKIISGEALTRSNAEVQSIAGDDIPYYVAEDFEKAFLKIKPDDDAAPAKLRVESDFWNKVMIPVLAGDPKVTLVAIGLDYKPQITISHELLHASYYENPELQKKVKQFWKEELAESDREKYLEVLKREKYDLTNEEQVENEFYAYTLEAGRATVFPESLIAKYRKRLSAYLKSVDPSL